MSRHPLVIRLVTSCVACCVAAVGAAQALPDIEVCRDQPRTLLAPAGYDYYAWTPTDQLSWTDRQLTITASESFTARLRASKVVSDNLLPNPGFSRGDEGFTSDLTYSPSFGPGSYTVIATGSEAPGSHADCPGLTDAADRYLAVHLAGSAAREVWCADVAVRPDTRYRYSVRAGNLSGASDATISILLNGTDVQTRQVEPATCIWRDATGFWNSGDATSLRMCIEVAGSNGSAPKIGLDQLELVELGPEYTDQFEVTVVGGAIAPTEITVPLCVNDRFTQYGLDLTPGQTARVTLETSAGCDSVLAITTVAVDTVRGAAQIDGLCEGSTITLDGESATLTRDTTVRRYLRARGGCDSVITYDLNTLSAEDFAIATGEINCLSEEGTLRVTGGTEDAPITVTWSDGGTGVTRSDLPLGSVGTATVTSERACEFTLPYEVPNPRAAAITDVSTRPPFCLGGADGAISFDLDTAATATWEGTVDLFGGEDSTRYPRDGLSSGRYRIISQSPGRCPRVVRVNVEDGPGLSLSLIGDTIARIGFGIEQELDLRGNTTPLEVNWFYDDEPLTEYHNALAVALYPEFLGELRVTSLDDRGCTATARQRILIESRDVQLLPTAFSPNGDGRNDTWKLLYHPGLIHLRQLRIFDRWGALIHQTGRRLIGEEVWDGGDVGTGVYTFVVTYDFLRDERVDVVSNVTVFR